MATFEAIASTTLGSTATTITFSSIPGDYQHLELRVFAQRALASDGDVNIRFNSDSGANYTYHYIQSNGTSVGATANINLTYTRVGIISENTTSQIFGVCIAQILDYASTNKYKIVRSISGYDRNLISGSDYGKAVAYSGLWRSTSAITTLSIQAGPQYSAGSVFALYGLRSS